MTSVMLTVTGRHVIAGLLLALSSLLAGACASHQPLPLATSHPAHPDAPVAPARPWSDALVYSPVDLPSAPPEPSGTTGSVAARSGVAAASLARTVVGEGEVVDTLPSSGQIVVDHEEIGGFMEAMTMGYRVEPPSLLAGLKEGDRIRFTIDVERRAIVGIEKR